MATNSDWFQPSLVYPVASSTFGTEFVAMTHGAGDFQNTDSGWVARKMLAEPPNKLSLQSPLPVDGDAVMSSEAVEDRGTVPVSVLWEFIFSSCVLAYFVAPTVFKALEG
jgi:hypothetical protein